MQIRTVDLPRTDLLARSRLGDWWWELATLLLAVAAGYLLVASPHQAIRGLALVGLALAFVAAMVHPSAVYVSGVVLLVAIPTYAAPSGVGGLPAYPASVAFSMVVAALLCTSMVRRARGALTLVDMVVLCFFVLLLVPVLYGVRLRSDYLATLGAWLAPYLASRLVLARYARPRTYPVAISLTALGLLPFVIYESITGINLFQRLPVLNPSEAFWLHADQRFGVTRVSASFGQSIALSMFLASAAVFALSLGLTAHRRRHSILWLVGAALLALGQSLTLSRTGWLVLAIGGSVAIGLVHGTGAGQKHRKAVITVITALWVFAVVDLVPSTANVLSLGLGDQNAQYRSQLYHYAFSYGSFGAWGNTVTSFPSSLYPSVDNAYLVIADQWGVVPVAFLLLIAISMFYALIKIKSADRIIAGVALANFAALTFVALITQQELFVWTLAGATSAMLARAAADQRESE